ncbi:ABC transporter ATP-binding protein [Bacillus sp. S/N-304-OC-R1]|uniref:ABC transporter ATP-binding protein n=1 Tax=Bacillus sp. S/N-304-OC-R1 TaxID=2758034 RepID=UPI001C8E3A15|nr:ABC transporter ATP-binding protein [Bacillus sp. S/N-304-OC-R1]MBY0122084.1 ABC transporter ATP-binding protein [Bacillus sp. S/N-304-OC-R1]
MAVLEASGVKKVYGERGNVHLALNGIHLRVEEGEFVGIMGPSGAGKSTLLNVLSTIDTPTGGHIKINEKNIMNLSENELARFRREQLGFIFQDFNLLDTLTAKENISLPLALSNISVAEIESRIKRISELLGIEKILGQYPYELSGGQQQRTSAARAIITNPSLIFADEPTGALDSKAAYSLLQTLSILNEKEKATILMVTHDAYAASFCKRVLVIKDGVIFTEIYKGEGTRKQFFQAILDILATLGGGGHHDVI